MQKVSALFKLVQRCLVIRVIGFLNRGCFFPILVRDLQMGKQTLFYLESGHVLQLRLLDSNTGWHEPHRCQELLLYRIVTYLRRRGQEHPNCTFTKSELIWCDIKPMSWNGWSRQPSSSMPNRQ